MLGGGLLKEEEIQLAPYIYIKHGATRVTKRDAFDVHLYGDDRMNQTQSSEGTQSDNCYSSVAFPRMWSGRHCASSER